MKKTWAWTLPVFGWMTLATGLPGLAWAQQPRYLAQNQGPPAVAPEGVPDGAPLGENPVEGTPMPMGDGPIADGPSGPIQGEMPVGEAPVGPMPGPGPNYGQMPQGYPQGPAPGYDPNYAGYAPEGCYEGAYLPEGDNCYGQEGGGHGRRRHGMHHRGSSLAGAGGLAAVLAHGVAPYLAPVTEGGYCQMRYYDVFAEAMFLGRGSAGDMPIIASDGVGGPAVLGGNSLGIGNKPGLRLNMALQVAAGRSIEFNYFGLFGMTASGVATSDTNNLFTSMSGYGEYPLGLGESNANRVSYNFEGTLDNYELNHRWRWVGADCRWQGSYLFGARFLGIGDKFGTRTFTPGADPFIYQEFENNVRTYTGLTGAQCGGDLWINLYPGIRAGCETKIGLFGAKGGVDNTLVSTTVDNGVVTTDNLFAEELTTGRMAVVGDMNFLFTYRIAESFTIRTGYNLLFVSAVNKAVSNYNPTAPITLEGVPARGVIRVANKGMDADFFHGANVGLEYMW